MNDHALWLHSRSLLIAVKNVTHHRKGLGSVEIRLTIGPALFVVYTSALQTEGLMI
jgi:hypothetical protein